MTPLNVAMMVMIPLSVATTLAFIVFSSRMSARTRLRLELAFTIVFYPTGVGMLVWSAVRNWIDGDLFTAVLMSGIAAVLSVQGLVFATRRVRALRPS